MRSRFLLILFALSLSSTQSWAQNQSKLPSILLQSGTRIAEDLVRRFPPDKYFILNFGQSSAITSAYIRQQIPDPIERAQYMSEIMVQKLNISGLDDLQNRSYEKYFAEAEDLETVTWRLLQKTIPSNKVLAGRTVIVHRTLISGFTLKSFLRSLSHFLATERKGSKLGLFILNNDPPSMDSAEIQEIRRSLGEHQRILKPNDVIIRHDRDFLSPMYKTLFHHYPNSEILTKNLFRYAETRPVSYVDLAVDPDLFGRANLAREELPAVLTKKCTGVLIEGGP